MQAPTSLADRDQASWKGILPMRTMISFNATMGASLHEHGASSASAPPPPSDEAAAPKPRFDTLIQPNDLRDWMKLPIAAEPNHVGSPHDEANAEQIATMVQGLGLGRKHRDPSGCSIQRRINESLELCSKLQSLSRPRCKSLQFLVIRALPRPRAALPAYVEYQADGDVRAGLVYAQLWDAGDDYKTASSGWVCSVKGRIVIARYGAGWREVEAETRPGSPGAIGCIIYSDPADDGYSSTKPIPLAPCARPKGCNAAQSSTCCSILAIH